MNWNTVTNSSVKKQRQVPSPLLAKLRGQTTHSLNISNLLKQFEDENTTARQTIPAPSQFLAELFREDNGITTRSFYPDLEELIQDIAAAYRQVIKDLYDAGCRNIQFDDCTWGMCCDHASGQVVKRIKSVTIEGETAKYLRLNNLALEGRPQDLAFTTHVCRGNYNSTWLLAAVMNQLPLFYSPKKM